MRQRLKKITFRQRLINWLQQGDESKEGNAGMIQNPLVSSRGSEDDYYGLSTEKNAVRFTVHRATGGYVVESRFYDEKQDRNNYNLHIITKDEDFAKELGHAVFMDLMKNQN